MCGVERQVNIVRHFENLMAKKRGNCRSTSTEAKYFADWVARLEVWSIESDEARKLKDFRFMLDREEVAEHVSDFLDIGRFKQKSDYREHKPYHSQWIVPFPTFLSDSLQIIIILKNAYFLGPDKVGAPMLETRPINHQQPVAIPISSGGSSKQAESPVRQGLKATNLESLALLESYSFQMNITETHILWQQLQGMNTAICQKPTILSLAVFELDSSGCKPMCYQCGQLELGTTQLSIAIAKFHPTLPLILLHNCDFMNGSAIHLWSFASSTSFEEACERKKGFSDVSTRLCAAPPSIEYLDFSACGLQVVFKHHRQPYQEVLTIQSNAVYESAALLQQMHQGPLPKPPLRTSDHRNRNDESQHLAPPDKRILSVNHSEVSAGKLSKIAKTSSQISDREVGVVKLTEDGEQFQPLLTLPNVKSVDGALRLQVRTSELRERNIRMILHKAEQPWYHMSDPPDVQFPALVEKDVRALAPPRKRLLNSQDKRNSRIKRRILNGAKASSPILIE